MSVEKITDKIIADAKDKEAQILSRAEDEARAIIENAKREAKDKADKIIEQGKGQEQLSYNRIISSGEMEAKKIMLKQKQEMIQNAFEEAKNKLNAMDNQSFFEIVKKLVYSSVKTADEVLLLNENTKKRLPENFLDILNAGISAKMPGSKLSVQIADVADGFILKRGDIEINMTFDAILRQNFDEISGGVVKILF